MTSVIIRQSAPAGPCLLPSITMEWRVVKYNTTNAIPRKTINTVLNPFMPTTLRLTGSGVNAVGGRVRGVGKIFEASP